MMTTSDYRPGLEGVVAAQTRLSSVDGEAGELIIAGYPLEELAGNATFEQVTYLLWNDRLPSDAELADFSGGLSARRTLPGPTMTILREAASMGAPPMDALRMAADTLSLHADLSFEEQAQTLVAAMPAVVAAYHRLVHGHDPVE